jgi:hypothetical protein
MERRVHSKPLFFQKRHGFMVEEIRMVGEILIFPP